MGDGIGGAVITVLTNNVFELLVSHTRDIRGYEIIEDDKILITFGGETDDQIKEYIKQLDNQEIMNSKFFYYD